MDALISEKATKKIHTIKIFIFCYGGGSRIYDRLLNLGEKNSKTDSGSIFKQNMQFITSEKRMDLIQIYINGCEKNIVWYKML